MFTGREVGLHNKLDPGEGSVSVAAEQNYCVTLKKSWQRLREGRDGSSPASASGDLISPSGPSAAAHLSFEDEQRAARTDFTPGHGSASKGRSGDPEQQTGWGGRAGEEGGGVRHGRSAGRRSPRAPPPASLLLKNKTSNLSRGFQVSQMINMFKM